MRKRTQAREIALQALYQYDLCRERDTGVPETFERFVEECTDDSEVREYATFLIDGATATLDELDDRIAPAAQNWKISRMAPVDRCVLRIALFELLESPEVPPKVAINEAIDLAKKFSTEQSGAFVNGILDRIYGELKRKTGERC
jgi:transcription antitermination factor NusB